MRSPASAPTEPGHDPAFAVLLDCARVTLGAGERKRIAERLAVPLDWDRLLALADFHGLRPLLFRHLGNGALGAIPPEFESRLWRHSEQLRVRNRMMEAELLRLVRGLEGEGIPVLVHKGPAVARLAYGDAALREYGDLDLLLPHAEMPRARALLEHTGYLPKYPMTPAAEAAFLADAGQYHQMFVHGGHGMLVELHWKTDAEVPAEQLAPGGPWGQARELRLDDGVVRCLPHGPFLLALLLHGSKHYWASLHWLVDAAELLRGASEEDWRWLLAGASRLRARRRLALGLVLVRDRLSVELPPFVVDSFASFGDVNASASEFAACWGEVPYRAPGGWERLRRDAALYDVPGQGRAQLLRILWKPGVSEWSRWPLPRRLHFLYGPLRLGGLLASALRRR
jgi:hypothetical protein